MMDGKTKKDDFSFLDLAMISVFSGIIAGLIMPGLTPFGFLAWVIFVPFLFTLKKSKTIGQSTLLSMLFGFFLNGITTLWIFNVWALKWAGIDGAGRVFMMSFAWFVVSLFVSLFFGLFGALSKIVFNATMPKLLKAVVVAGLYVLCTNKLLSFSEVAFPWAMIEYSQYNYLQLIQITQIIKGTGLAFLILFVNAYIGFYLFPFDEVENKIKFCPKHLLTLLVIFLGLFGYGYNSLSKNIETKDLTVTLAQTNVNSKNLDNVGNLQFDYIRDLKFAYEGLVVFPEITMDGQISTKSPEFINRFSKIGKDQNKVIIAGVWNKVWAEEKQSYQNENAAYLFENGKVQKYIKNKLVPFGEYVPRWGLPKILEVKFFDKLVKTEFVRGKEMTVFDTSLGKIAPNICYEVMFPSLIRSQVKQGADLIVNISNPCWFENRALKEQLYAASVFRARENSRYYISSMNTGLSFILAPNGKLLYETENDVTYVYPCDLRIVNNLKG